MKWIAVLLLVAVPAYPQDPEKNPEKDLEQAEKLEAQAEKLLDAGKRKEAFEALARASELRRQAKAGPKPEAKPEARKPIGKPKPSPKPEKMTDPVEAAHAELDAALQKGDLEAARVASERLRDAREKQAKRIAALEKRLEAMQRQMVEIRKLIAGGKRPK